MLQQKQEDERRRLQQQEEKRQQEEERKRKEEEERVKREAEEEQKRLIEEVRMCALCLDTRQIPDCVARRRSGSMRKLSQPPRLRSKAPNATGANSLSSASRSAALSCPVHRSACLSPPGAELARSHDPRAAL